MSKFKFSNEYYLNKDMFSSVSSDRLWTKLFNYISSNSKMSDNIKYDRNELRIRISSPIYGNPLIKLAPPDEIKIDRNIVRVTQLNTTFDKATKSLILTDENVENFPEYNSVSYQMICKNKLNDNLDSLFFHESSLVDYTMNFNKDDYLACQKYLMIVTFTNTRTVVDDETGTPHGSRNDDIIFVCFDKSTNRIDENSFPILNQGTSIDVDAFISAYNNDKSTLNDALNTVVEDGGNTIFNYYSDFKSAVSMFKLIDGDELEFVNFKSFNSIRYDKFIKSLRSKLTEI